MGDCVRLIWRLRRKQQIKKKLQREENKKIYTEKNARNWRNGKYCQSM